jgi:hypothetical protein
MFPNSDLFMWVFSSHIVPCRRLGTLYCALLPTIAPEGLYAPDNPMDARGGIVFRIMTCPGVRS